MPVLYGLETAQFANETLRELRYDVWQAVRAGRSCSRVEAIEALLTICAPGHRIDPVQYLAYGTVKSWIRWLRQPHLDQDSERLQRSWLRMHDFACPAGTSSRGLVAPPLTDPISRWTAVTLWTAILASTGCKWIAPCCLLVDGTRYDLRDMTVKEQKTLDHLLRQALRNRELRDVRADIRRGRLRKRAEFEGVDEPIDWDRTRRLGSAQPPQEEGVWQTIVAGGVLTRDRLFRHGRLLAQDAQEGRCVLPGCMEEVPETLTHRFWTCAAREHLRSPNFRAIRDTMELRHPCELMCGIVLNSFPLHFDTVDMQRCTVAIELNARRLLDERGATRDDPLAHQRETGTWLFAPQETANRGGPEDGVEGPGNHPCSATPCLFSGWGTCPVQPMHESRFEVSFRAVAGFLEGRVRRST